MIKNIKTKNKNGKGEKQTPYGAAEWLPYQL